jgi:CheY-like chemotaxis protein
MDEIVQTVISTLLTPVAFALTVATAWALRRWIRDIVKTLRVKSLKATAEGWEVELDLEEFAARTYRKQGMGPPSPADIAEMETLVDSFGRFVGGRRIPWVDNHPANNELEHRALVRWGVDVQTRRSTEEAVTELRDERLKPFDLVISDWFRGGKPEGQRLAELMQSEPKPVAVPIIYYFSASRSDPHLFESIRDKALGLGAVGATSSPRELLRWTFAELVRASLRDPRTTIGPPMEPREP